MAYHPSSPVWMHHRFHLDAEPSPSCWELPSSWARTAQHKKERRRALVMRDVLAPGAEALAEHLWDVIRQTSHACEHGVGRARPPGCECWTRYGLDWVLETEYPWRADAVPQDIQESAWLAVRASNQQEVDARLPALFKARFLVRALFLSPLTGPVDLSHYVTPLTPMAPREAPATWAEWTWPEWVPEEARQQVQKFWSDTWGRGPREWLRDYYAQGAPPFGHSVQLHKLSSSDEWERGRYVHCWNNIGRVIRADGSMGYVSFPRSHLFDGTRYAWQRLGWVCIAGAATKPTNKAPVCELSWVRALVRQCELAAVPAHLIRLGSNVWHDPHDGEGRARLQYQKKQDGSEPADWPEDLRGESRKGIRFLPSPP